MAYANAIWLKPSSQRASQCQHPDKTAIKDKGTAKGKGL